MGKGAKQLKRQLPVKSKEQIAYDRAVTKKNNRFEIISRKRILEYKQNQVTTGNVTETRNIHEIPDGTIVTVDGFVDGKKPMHIIENEIDKLNYDIEFFEDQNKNIEELENAEKPA